MEYGCSKEMRGGEKKMGGKVRKTRVFDPYTILADILISVKPIFCSTRPRLTEILVIFWLAIPISVSRQKIEVVWADTVSYWPI